MNIPNTLITAQEFFKHWVDICKQRHKILFKDFSNPPVLTAHMLTEENSVIEAIAKRLNLNCYCGYYSIDAILFKDPDDRVPVVPAGTTWVRRIRVAFEHENYFKSGLFQEVSHLLITDCDLRVLVSYPENDDDLEREFDNLHKIIKGSDRSNQISEAGSFLFIVDRGNNSIDYWGYVFKNDGWQKLE